LGTRAKYDLLVVGGGINGCGIARDAAGRGFSVLLAEKGDLAQATSSASTKLIHGGLRYLEQYEFRLVREALAEREVLWHIAPHVVSPLRFILPHHAGLRPAWLLRLGLFLYDHLGGRRLLPPTRTIDLRQDPAGIALKPGYRRAFEYSDCRVDDARLVVLNARDAADRGADIRTHTEVRALQRDGAIWNVTLRGEEGDEEVVTARMVINATGPWVDGLRAMAAGTASFHDIRLVQGSHIVVRRKSADPRAFIFQNADGRIVFAIPYENDFTLIGTTDRDYSGDRDKVAITEAEVNYLCTAASEYFSEPVQPADVVWTYAGVRALHDDGTERAQEATRDYSLTMDGGDGVAPIVHAFGGKITTYRRLAEAMMVLVGNELGARGAPWTATAPLPGGAFPPMGVEIEIARLRKRYDFLSAALAGRLIRSYGLCAYEVLGEARELAELGLPLAPDLHEAELRYLADREWARNVDDVFWRRTKIGLKASAAERNAVAAFMDQHHHAGWATETSA